MVRASTPALGDVVYRVSDATRARFAEFVEATKKNPNAANSVKEMEELVARFDAAKAAGEATFRLDNDSPPPSLPATNPMAGTRVVVLTDYACNSACLDLMDLFMNIPGVAQAGVSTQADTTFMEITPIDPPSGNVGFYTPHKSWIERPRRSNVAYVPRPEFTYHGDLGSEDQIKAWIESAVLPKL